MPVVDMKALLKPSLLAVRVKRPVQRARYGGHVAHVARLTVDAREPQRLIEQVPRVAAEALQVEHGVVYLLDTERLELRVAGGVGLLPEEDLDARVPNGPGTLAGRVVAEGRPIVVTGVDHEQRFAVAPCYRDAGLTRALAVPLLDRGRVIGVLAVRARDATRFGVAEVGFLETLSSLLAMSLQRAQCEEALSHAQSLKSVGQLTGGVAHDFNNLLTVISGNLQMLEDLPAIARDPVIRQMVGAAGRATRRGAELTGKLLASSRRLVLQPAPVDVGAMLHSLADILSRTLDQRIRITVDVASDCPACLADPGQLECALLNMAINARDAMTEGGTLSFAGRAVDDLPPEAGADRPIPGARGCVAIAVADTGRGMSDTVKSRAFEPFFTTKETGRGTGLGLSTVHGFAHQSHGAVVLASMLGVGTTITLFLPQCCAAEVGAANVVVPASVPAGLRVLLVEDDTEVRVVAQGLLAALACEVTACASAEQALGLSAWRDDRASFDLLLTDIALGAGRSGPELAQEVQRRWPALPVLLVSGFSSEVLETPSPWPLLRKPYSRADLAQALAQALLRSASRGGRRPGADEGVQTRLTSVQAPTAA
ncbi:MAG TPA: GAF domain-containing protein [Caldimonas sp.]